MAWIEVHQALLTHRKTLRLARLLHLDTFAVVGRLAALWCWALDNAPDGTVDVQDSDILGAVMGWPGESSELCRALVTAGFLEEDESLYIIHDWNDYAGKIIDQRKANARRQQSWRERHKAGGQPTPPDEHDGHVTVMSPSRNGATVPNRTQPNRTQPERENAREARCEMASELPTTASGPITDLSLSPVASQEMAEAEAEPEPEPEAAAKQTPIRDPKAERDAAHALYDAWCTASGIHAGPASERRNWLAKLGEMARDVGLSPPGCAALVERYRAIYRNNQHPSPGQVAAVYSQLEQDPSTDGTHQHHGPSRQQTAEARARDDEARAERKRVGLAALAAQLAARQPDTLPPVPRPHPAAVGDV